MEPLPAPSLPKHERGSARSVAPKVKAPNTSPATGGGAFGKSLLPRPPSDQQPWAGSKVKWDPRSWRLPAQLRSMQAKRMNPKEPKLKPETVLECSHFVPRLAWPELLHFGLGPGISQSRAVPGPEIELMRFRV